ncbi:MAG TPA: hypothetical protein PLP61_00370 [Nocardioides sp.]|uniref:hypothetical protein n=1 Tax=Nocardioides sp. TaxID=35761 RepID=UPI002BC8E3C2|nr:hypothetical protein [Nocardioides sp.]HQR25467.1 hypothetical protein [Nocardioides sp.]
MDTPPAHWVYADADTPHEMACDCACACDNLHLTPGSNDHTAHVADCETREPCELHIDEAAVRLADAVHLHLD